MLVVSMADFNASPSKYTKKLLALKKTVINGLSALYENQFQKLLISMC